MRTQVLTAGRTDPSLPDEAEDAVIAYRVEENALGTWRRHVYPSGQSYSEFTSHRTLFGLPLVHVTLGRNPETGRRKTARGIIAIGRFAAGVVAIGQVALGFVGIGQLGVGLLSLGQAALGLMALGQLAIGTQFALGQVAVGAVAIGQLALGKMVLAQVGFGEHVWSVDIKDPAAIAYFKDLAASLLGRWFPG